LWQPIKQRIIQMSTKRTVAALLALVLAATASAAQAAPHRTRNTATPAGAAYQGEAPPWSFACMKDHGPTNCGEPMWIYGN
jgi:invasion protein IalB